MKLRELRPIVKKIEEQMEEFKGRINDAIKNEAEKKELHECLLKMVNVIKNDMPKSTDDDDDEGHKEEVLGKLFIKSHHAYVRC